ncbi:MAG: leucine-rich repeat protein [Bacteroidales bacterium]|nr:leucine-rich repeat protein [Bacteroidales bacterium]
MKLRFAFLGLLALIAVSCSYEETFVTEDNIDNSAAEFYATIDEQPDADTKVYADENLKVLWNADDRITIFNQNTYNQQYRFTGENGDNAGGFRIVKSDDEFITSNPLDNIYAVYPYRETNKISNSGVVTTSIPSEQTYKANSFGIGANTMVSVAESNMLKFKNVGGYLSLKFYGEGVSVSSITLKSNNGELIAGDCTIDMSSGLPLSNLITENASDAITMVCDPPIELPAEKTDAVMAIFVLYPGTLTGGFAITINTTDGRVFEKSSINERIIERSSLARFGAVEVVLDPLPFTPDGSLVSELSIEGIDTIDYQYASFERYNPVALNNSVTVQDQNAFDVVFPQGALTTYEVLGESQCFIPSNNSRLSYIKTSPELDFNGFQWALMGKDAEDGTGPSSWSPVINDIVFDDDSRVLVDFSISSPNFLPSSAPLSSIALVANNSSGSSICSDWLSIRPNGEIIHHLAFDTSNAWMTENDNDCHSVLNATGLAKDLYETAYDAVSHIPSVQVRYNGGPIDLASMLSIHSFIPVLDQYNDYSFAEFVEKYPSFALKFDLIPYTMRDNHTSEDMYGKIDGTIFTPCYVLAISGSPTSIVVQEGGENEISDGISSVGRIPLVVATLENENTGEVAARGYFRIEISKDGVPKNVIYYTSIDGSVIKCNNVFGGATLLSNEYVNGCGVLTFDGTVTSIGKSTFKDCINLNSITIPDNVTSIGHSAFYGCSSLTSIKMPSSLSSIYDEVFKNCTNLTSIKIPGPVSKIGKSAFECCSGLTTIIVPSGVKSIGMKAFMGCSSLNSITIDAPVPPLGSDNMFDDTNNCPIYVPAESVEAYKTAEYWSYYAYRIKPIE